MLAAVLQANPRNVPPCFPSKWLVRRIDALLHDLLQGPPALADIGLQNLHIPQVGKTSTTNWLSSIGSMSPWLGLLKTRTSEPSHLLWVHQWASNESKKRQEQRKPSLSAWSKKSIRFSLRHRQIRTGSPQSGFFQLLCYLMLHAITCPLRPLLVSCWGSRDIKQIHHGTLRSQSPWVQGWSSERHGHRLLSRSPGRHQPNLPHKGLQASKMVRFEKRTNDRSSF